MTYHEGFMRALSNLFLFLPLRDLIPIIAALEYNQWFTKLSSKDLKLVSDQIQHICLALVISKT